MRRLLSLIFLLLPLMVSAQTAEVILKGKVIDAADGYPIIGASVVVAASIIRHGMDNVWYLIVFAVISGIGALFYRGGTGVSVSDKIKAKLFGAKAAADENDVDKAE